MKSMRWNHLESDARALYVITIMQAHRNFTVDETREILIPSLAIPSPLFSFFFFLLSFFFPTAVGNFILKRWSEFNYIA